MKVVFLFGPPAAGKHTIGSLLSKETGLPLFHNHLTVDLATSLFEFGTPGFVQLREQVWLASFSAAADAGRSFIFTFSPESTVDPALIGKLEKAVTQRGGAVVYIELLCSEEVVLERIDDESRRQFGKLVDKTLYTQLKAEGSFAFPPLPAPTFQVDTETLTPEESARAIVAVLKSL